MRRAVVGLILLAAIGLLGWQVWQKAKRPSERNSARGPRGAVVAVEAEPVLKATIRDVRRFTGSLRAKAYFVVAPKVSGRLVRLPVDIGTPVARGQLIAVLDDEEYTEYVEQARAELQLAQARVEECCSTLEIAQRNFERARTLREKLIASESELDRAQTAYKVQDAKRKVALAQVAQKQAALKTAQVRLSYTQIRASWEGGDEERIVGERFADEGAMLRANDPIVSVIDIRSLIAVIHVIERDYPRLRAGQEAVVTTDAFPGRTFTGKVVRVAPLLKETSRQARVELEIPNADRLLKPGMFIRAQIEFARHDNATVVPVTALAKRNGKQGVFLANVQDKKARFVPVTLGIVNGEMAEVVAPPLSGLVVTLGQHLLADGVAITLPERPSEGPAGKPAQSTTRTGPSGARSPQKAERPSEEGRR